MDYGEHMTMFHIIVDEVLTVHGDRLFLDTKKNKNES